MDPATQVFVCFVPLSRFPREHTKASPFMPPLPLRINPSHPCVQCMQILEMVSSTGSFWAGDCPRESLISVGAILYVCTPREYLINITACCTLRFGSLSSNFASCFSHHVCIESRFWNPSHVTQYHPRLSRVNVVSQCRFGCDIYKASAGDHCFIPRLSAGSAFCNVV